MDEPLPTREERAVEVLRLVTLRALSRPPPDASEATWASYQHSYPPFVAGPVPDDAPLHTPAELALGQVLDALADDSPWLARLERADEDCGRPLGDGLRLSRWAMVLIDMHYPNLWPHTREEFGKKLRDRVWAVYREMLAARRVAA
jgi:hypothetical protein